MQFLKICRTSSDPFTVARNQFRQQRGVLGQTSAFVQASGEAESADSDYPEGPALDALDADETGAPDLETQTLAIVSMIETQLDRYLSVMSARTEAAQRAAEASQDELARHFQSQIDTLRADLDNQPEVPTELELPAEVIAELQVVLRDGIQTELQATLHTALRDELRQTLHEELRASLRVELRSQLHTELRAELQGEMQTQLRSEQLEEREKVGARLNQFATQASAAAQQLVDTATSLHQRINDTGRALEGQIEEHSVALAKTIEESVETSRATISNRLDIVARKVDDNDQRTVDRMLAMEGRINDQTGTRFADLDANVGRITRGMDEAFAAMSHRLAELDAAHLGMAERIEKLALDVSKVDEEAIDQLKEQMSSAVGESMLVRIEMERLGASTSEQIDKVNVRIGELATIVNDTTMDVSTAIQLERLEELERAVIELDPDQFVRKSDVNGGGAPAPRSTVDPAAERDALADYLAMDRTPAPAPPSGADVTSTVDDEMQEAETNGDAPGADDDWFDQLAPPVQLVAASEPHPDALAAMLEWEEHVEAVIGGNAIDETAGVVAIDPTKAHPRRRASDFGVAEGRSGPHLLRRATDARVNNPHIVGESEHQAGENGQVNPPEALDEAADQAQPFLPPSPPKHASEAYASDSTLSSW